MNQSGGLGVPIQISALRPTASCNSTQKFSARRADHRPFAKHLQICSREVRSNHSAEAALRVRRWGRADRLTTAAFTRLSVTVFICVLGICDAHQFWTDRSLNCKTLRRTSSVLSSVLSPAEPVSCSRSELGVNFREVVHSVRTGNADVAKP